MGLAPEIKHPFVLPDNMAVIKDHYKWDSCAGEGGGTRCQLRSVVIDIVSLAFYRYTIPRNMRYELYTDGTDTTLTDGTRVDGERGS